MKKILLLFSVFVLFSCSSDGDGNLGDDSQIMIDDTEFIPAENTDDWPHAIRTYYAMEGDLKTRTFLITDYVAVGQDPKAIAVTIHYTGPDSQMSGVYGFDESVFGTDHYAIGRYTPGSPSIQYLFDSGEVKVTAYGNNRYKLVFDNIHGFFSGTSSEITVTGYFDGTFTVVN